MEITDTTYCQWKDKEKIKESHWDCDYTLLQRCNRKNNDILLIEVLSEVELIESVLIIFRDKSDKVINVETGIRSTHFDDG